MLRIGPHRDEIRGFLAIAPLLRHPQDRSRLDYHARLASRLPLHHPPPAPQPRFEFARQKPGPKGKVPCLAGSRGVQKVLYYKGLSTCQVSQYCTGNYAQCVMVLEQVEFQHLYEEYKSCILVMLEGSKPCALGSHGRIWAGYGHAAGRGVLGARLLLC